MSNRADGLSSSEGSQDMLLRRIRSYLDSHILKTLLPQDIYVRYTRSVTKQKESLIPNDCHCGKTNCTG